MTIQTSRELQKGSIATLRGLLKFLLPYKKQFVLAGIALIVAAAATLAIPYACLLYTSDAADE